MKKIAVLASAFVASAVAAFPALAALPAAVGTAMTAVGTDADDIFDAAFPVVAAVMGLTIVVKLFKRFISKI